MEEDEEDPNTDGHLDGCEPQPDGVEDHFEEGHVELQPEEEDVGEQRQEGDQDIEDQQLGVLVLHALAGEVEPQRLREQEGAEGDELGGCVRTKALTA